MRATRPAPTAGKFWPYIPHPSLRINFKSLISWLVEPGGVEPHGRACKYILATLPPAPHRTPRSLLGRGVHIFDDLNPNRHAKAAGMDGVIPQGWPIPHLGITQSHDNSVLIQFRSCG